MSLNVIMTAGEIDGGVVDDDELAALIRRTGEQLGVMADDLDPARAGQLRAVVALLDIVARRLESPAPEATDRAELGAALDAADDDRSLALARRIAAAELERAPAPQWELFA
jgi:hypothetical protein